MSKVIVFKIQYWDSNQESLTLNPTDLLLNLNIGFCVVLFLKQVCADTGHRGRRDLNTRHIVKETSLICQVSESRDIKSLVCGHNYFLDQFTW